MHTSKEKLDEKDIPWDSAIPLNAFKELCDIAGFNVTGHIVTAYPKGFVYGVFLAVTEKGASVLERWGSPTNLEEYEQFLQDEGLEV